MPDTLTFNADRSRLHLLYYFCRMQMPTLRMDAPTCERHLQRTYQLYANSAAKKEKEASWNHYLDNLYPLDWFLTSACLEGLDEAWERLFAVRLGKTDSLLLDALRAQACRLFPRNPERQESAVAEFWSSLVIPPDRPGALPFLARYDGQRPLAPWLIRVFHNHHVSLLRGEKNHQYIPDDDYLPLPPEQQPQQDHWHDVFCQAARDWLETINDKELLLLGLRLRHQMSQRETAEVLGVHEGTISRRIDELSKQWRENISQNMIKQGWTGDDLGKFVRTEMRDLLMDDSRLSADHLAQLLSAEGKTLPKK